MTKEISIIGIIKCYKKNNISYAKSPISIYILYFYYSIILYVELGNNKSESKLI